MGLPSAPQSLSPAQAAVWLDCDPGHDDALAIIMAGHSPGIKLLGLSTVAGNQSLAKVTQNALDILDAAGLSHIEVVSGQVRPLIRPSLMICPEIHGDSGLDGPKGGHLLPRSSRVPIPGPAPVVMAEALKTAMAEGGLSRVVLVCTGSLTNAALLLTVYPELVTMGLEVVLMGGCIGKGNTGPVQEFNIQVDPEAAHMVFESGVKLTMIPLEVTHTVLVTPDILGRLRALGTPAGASTLDAAVTPNSSLAPSAFTAAIEQLLLFFRDTYWKVFYFEHPPLHDPCATCFVLAPEIFKVEHMRVDIETMSPHSSGQTVCDVWKQTGKPSNCHVAVSVDVEAFWDLQLAALDKANALSPLNAGQT